MRRRLLSGWLLSLAALLPFSPMLAEESQLTLLSGEKTKVTNLSLENGAIRGDIAVPVPLDEVLEITNARRPLPATKSPLVADLVGGGRVFAQSIVIADDKCRIETLALDTITLPIDALRGFRAEAGNRDNYEKALTAPSAKNDRIFLKVEDKVESLPGTLESVAELEFTFDYEGGKRNMPRERLFGVVLSASPNADAAKARVTLLDGSVVAGELISLTDGNLKTKLGRKGEVTIPWEIVSNVTLKSDRLTWLSELKPSAEEQQSLVSFPLPWRADRSVTGKPLTLGGKRYSRGIGMHAECRLTFELDGKYDEFRAILGIDGEVHGKGDCQFRVVADGTEVLTRRVRGADAPYELTLNIKGVKELALIAEPGEGLDLGDHADWADARLLRNTAPKATRP